LFASSATVAIQQVDDPYNINWKIGPNHYATLETDQTKLELNLVATSSRRMYVTEPDLMRYVGDGQFSATVIADLVTEPVLTGLREVAIANSAPTTVTGFTSAAGDNQIVTLYFSTSNTTVKHGINPTNVSMKDGADRVCPQYSILRIRKVGSRWSEY
jgi:hypothetical protein